MTLTEKVSYLKGLMDGIELDVTSKEGKIFKAIADVLDDMAITVSDIEDVVGEMGQQIDEIDDDLSAIEEEWYDDYDEDDDDETIYEVECPSCNEVICIDEELADEGSIDCPNCGEHLEFDFEDEDDDCDCDCDCDSCKHD